MTIRVHILLVFCAWLSSCDKNNESGQELLLLPAPVIYGKEMHIPQKHTFNTSVVELGRNLFYDKRLSLNKQVSCASCHKQQLAFTDGAATSVEGVNNVALERNAPTLVNAGWYASYFWDGGSQSLEMQALGPLSHPDEMGNKIADVLAFLRTDDYYSNAFKKAFKTDKIKTKHLMLAIGQFERAIVSKSSRYDKFVAGEVEFSSNELKGKYLFEENCKSCHTPGLFTDNRFHNNGLDSHFVYVGEGHAMGRFRVTADSTLIGVYKTPTLRNVTITAPYMHDGRFQSLEEVIDHYSKGIKQSATVDSLFVNSTGFSFSKEEKSNMLAFLSTLTDSSILNNPKLSNPFK